MTQNTPLLEIRTYFGTLVIPRRSIAYTIKPGSRVTIASILPTFATPEQSKWIERNAPDFSYWRDEFTNQYHLYVKRPISENKLMLAQMLFTFTKPSHYPLGDEANWAACINSFKSN